MTIFVYHELQDSHLCGQHCLNNLLQEDFFSAVLLAEIAQELDEQERSIISPTDVYSPRSEQSSNVDESGNFSIQVLRVALERYHNIDLVPWHFKSEGADSDPLQQQGFVVNRSEHWFTIRKIKDTWWNLNSTSELPEVVSQFYLSALLHQLRNDGYSVFIAKGNLNTNTTGKPYNSNAHGDSRNWYTEEELLNKTGGTRTDSTPAKPTPFSGVGHRLGGDDDSSGAVNMQDFMVEGEDNEEDLQLLRAISASMASAAKPVAATATPSSGDAKKDAAAELRAKRLAALEKRGL